jgi:hypothetical protein
MCLVNNKLLTYDPIHVRRWVHTLGFLGTLKIQYFWSSPCYTSFPMIPTQELCQTWVQIIPVFAIYYWIEYRGLRKKNKESFVDIKTYHIIYKASCEEHLLKRL